MSNIQFETILINILICDIKFLLNSFFNERLLMYITLSMRFPLTYAQLESLINPLALKDELKFLYINSSS